jgi:hypothetical protein
MGGKAEYKPQGVEPVTTTSKKEVVITNKTTGETFVGYQNVKPQGHPGTHSRAEAQSGGEQSHMLENPSNSSDQREPIPAVVTRDGIPEEERARKKKEKKAKRQIENIPQFIEYAYGRRGQHLVCPPLLAKQLARSERLTDQQKQKLLLLSDSDLTFSVPRQLLLTSREVLDESILRSELRGFVRFLMLNHVYFVRNDLEGVISNLPDASPVGNAVAQLSAGTVEVLANSALAGLKPSEFDAMRKNAAFCLLIWAAEARQLSFQEVCEILYSSVLEKEAEFLSSETDRLRALTDAQELAAVAVVCGEFRKRAEDSMRSAQTAKQDAESARLVTAELRSQLENHQAALANLQEKIDIAESSAENQRNAHRTALLHARDDFEALRARVMRRIKDDVALLEEGLVALNREPPKVDVMIDHADRVVEALRGEVRKLEGEK